MVDCSWGFGNNGCDGGEDYRAYSWIKAHGIPIEDEYGPYLSQVKNVHLLAIIETMKQLFFILETMLLSGCR